MKWDNNEKESKVLREPPEGDLKSNYIEIQLHTLKPMSLWYPKKELSTSEGELNWSLWAKACRLYLTPNMTSKGLDKDYPVQILLVNNQLHYVKKYIEAYIRMYKNLKSFISLHKIIDLNIFNVSSVTDFSYLFTNLEVDIDVSRWDMSNATSIKYMFKNAKARMGDISKWDLTNIRNVEEMRGVFYNHHIPLPFLEWETMGIPSYNDIIFRE